MSGTGGTTGIEIMKNLSKEWGKEIVFSRVLIACCPEEIMKRALKKFRRRIVKSDALVVISCSGGVKTSILCKPEVPVISVLNPVGLAAITDRDDSIVRSICTVCGQCVITYTGGICPLYGCPAKSKYEPCKKAPKEGGKCALDKNIDCVWKEISEKGDLAALKKLRKIHKAEDKSKEYPSIPEEKNPPKIFTRIAAWHAVRMQRLEWIIRLFR